MRKLESKCSLVVPQTVPQLIYQGAESGTKFGKGSAPNTLPLNAIRGNLAERVGFEPPVGVLAPTTQYKRVPLVE